MKSISVCPWPHSYDIKEKHKLLLSSCQALPLRERLKNIQIRRKRSQGTSVLIWYVENGSSSTLTLRMYKINQFLSRYQYYKIEKGQFVQQMVLGKIDNHMQKTDVESLLLTIHKIYSKLIIDKNLRYKTSIRRYRGKASRNWI
jgi:hypothetical protein